MFTPLEHVWNQSKKLPLDSKSIKSAAIDGFIRYQNDNYSRGRIFYMKAELYYKEISDYVKRHFYVQLESVSLQAQYIAISMRLK